jgi:N-acetylglucosaminyl-diphospho-decaprenol L-rhamnosyltransferase
MSADPEDVQDPGPDLTVVVCNYNTGEYLTRCLRSAFEQAGDTRIEVIVVDNASRDGSADRAVAANPAARLIRNPDNRGFAAAVNQGLAASRAPYALLLNPDGEIVSGTLGGFLKVAREHPRAGAIGPVVRDPDGAIYPSARKVPSTGEAFGHAFVGLVRPNNRWSRAYKLADWDRRSERQVDWVSGSCMLINRAAMAEVGPLDERFFLYVEDVDFCRRLRAAGWEVWFSPELEVVHVGGVSTGRSRWARRHHARSIYRYYAKHRTRPWEVAARPVVWVGLRAWARAASWRLGER